MPPTAPTLRPPFAEKVLRRYTSADTDGLKRLHARAANNEEELLCRFRLYPVLRDETYLKDVPDPVTGSARELALIAGLWAYKTAVAPAWRVPGYGKRSEMMLRAARQADPDDPYVLLVRGQGQLYKPKLMGGDAKAAVATFENLRGVLEGTDMPMGLSIWEAKTFAWLARCQTDKQAAAAERERLLAEEPPKAFELLLKSES
jgi:hypothetical protein